MAEIQGQRTNNIFNDINKNLRELYSYRNILKSLVIKNLVGRYKNTAFGFAWHFITPVIMLLVYYFAFGVINKSSIDLFWLYLGIGLFPFNFMISNLAGGATCITGNSGMVNKIYFPRSILILAQTISTAIIMLLGLSIIITIMIFIGYSFNPAAILVAIIISLLMFMFVNGYVLIFASLNVYKRDVQHFLTSITILFYFMSPMYFTVDQISENLSKIIWFNPFTYYLEAFHKVFYYRCIPDSKIIAGCTLFAIVSLIVGAFLFNKLKHNFAERL